MSVVRMCLVYIRSRDWLSQEPTFVLIVMSRAGDGSQVLVAWSRAGFWPLPPTPFPLLR